MRIFFTVDIRDFLDAAGKMALEKRLPEFASKTLKSAARDLVETRARERIGNGGFGQDLAAGIRAEAKGPDVTIDHVSNDTNHLAQHVHEGGIVRPKNHKYLAIPLRKDLRGESPRLYTWKAGNPIFLPRKHGPGWVMLDETGRGKKKKLKPIFALVPETAPQRPRPWWPEDKDFLELAERETRWWVETYLPKTV